MFAPKANKAQASARKILVTCVLFALLASISVSTVSANTNGQSCTTSPDCADTCGYGTCDIDPDTGVGVCVGYTPLGCGSFDNSETNCNDCGCYFCEKCDNPFINQYSGNHCTEDSSYCNYDTCAYECGAECVNNIECDTVFCSHLDGCYPDNGGEIYVMCPSLSNLCIDCQCTDPECPSDPAAVCAPAGTDSDGDGFDDECEECDSEPALQTASETPETSCGDGVDNDCDGLTDCEDPDCDGVVTDVACGVGEGDPLYGECDGTYVCDLDRSENDYKYCSTEDASCGLFDCPDGCDQNPDGKSFTYDYAQDLIKTCDENGVCNGIVFDDCTYTHYCCDNDMNDTVPFVAGYGDIAPDRCDAECDEEGDIDCESYCDGNIHQQGFCDLNNTCGCGWTPTDCGRTDEYCKDSTEEIWETTYTCDEDDGCVPLDSFVEDCDDQDGWYDV
ncbi:MAG: hypothetical protein GF334_12935, partial [Candidatus Altiarchaeales archaeon]|nr:hypothetical protein [Candidatus Altiarchaeales archaeon]